MIWAIVGLSLACAVFIAGQFGSIKRILWLKKEVKRLKRSIEEIRQTTKDLQEIEVVKENEKAVNSPSDIISGLSDN